MTLSNGETILKRVLGLTLTISATLLLTVGLYIVIDFMAVAIKYGGVTSFAISGGYTFWRLFFAVISLAFGKRFFDYGLEALKGSTKA